MRGGGWAEAGARILEATAGRHFRYVYSAAWALLVPCKKHEPQLFLTLVTKCSNHFYIETNLWMPLGWGVNLKSHSCFVFR